jgi:hypothetical protein
MRYLTTIPLITLLLLGGCYTAKKADKAIDKAQRNHPEVVAKKARSLYPCVTVGADTSTILIDSNIQLEVPDNWYYPVQIEVDSFKSDANIAIPNLDSVIIKPINKKKITIPIKIPQRTINTKVEDKANTFLITKQCEDEKKALNDSISYYKTKYAVTSKQLSDTTKSRNKWRKWCLITWVLVAAFVSVYFLLPKLLNR